MQELLKRIKERIRPELNVLKEIDEFLARVNELIKKSGISAVCVKGGSTAKGTFLKNDYDVDLFVRFDYALKDKPLSDMLEQILKPLKPERVHGSRDYFQVKNHLIFEIVPVLDITDYRKAVNVTDMSPLHVDWVRKHLDEKPELQDEIRLAKQFCKATGVYGAESYIQGFSGHVLDILIIYYGSFENFLRKAAEWKARTIIDIEEHLKDPMHELNRSKTYSPLIIVDPLQPDRNASAALSREKYHLFIQKAREFLKSPGEELFKIKTIDVKELKKQYAKEWLILLEVAPLEGKKDVVGSKLLKVFTYIRQALKKNDFRIIKAGWEFKDKALFFYIVRKEELSKELVREGPPVKAKEDYERFMNKHKKTYVKNNRVYAVMKRESLEPTRLISELMKDKYVKEKIISMKPF